MERLAGVWAVALTVRLANQGRHWVAVIRNFRDLIAWQKGMALAKQVYLATQRMPTAEQFELTSQMRRAATSVPSNIAEGYALESTKAYLRHLKIARGSLAELSTQWELATVGLELLRPDTSVLSLMNETDRVLQGLIRAVQRSQQKTK